MLQLPISPRNVRKVSRPKQQRARTAINHQPWASRMSSNSGNGKHAGRKDLRYIQIYSDIVYSTLKLTPVFPQKCHRVIQGSWRRLRLSAWRLLGPLHPHRWEGSDTSDANVGGRAAGSRWNAPPRAPSVSLHRMDTSPASSSGPPDLPASAQKASPNPGRKEPGAASCSGYSQ